MIGACRHEWEAEITPQGISVLSHDFLPLGDTGLALRILEAVRLDWIRKCRCWPPVAHGC